jgi:RHS repeat-associated protein
LRPIREATSIPADPGGAWSAKSFTVERSYDRNLGRPKAMSYPSGEWVAFDYDAGGRGYPVGETQVNADYSLSATHYRRVTSLSPRGQTTQQTFGNGVQESLVYEPGSGLVLGDTVTGLVESAASCTTPAGTLVHSFAYSYDQFLNLARQTKQIPLRSSANGPLSFTAACGTTNEAVSEVYAYDDLQRLLSEFRSWQGNTRPVPTAPANPDSYSYDDLGNIWSKSDYASSYSYGTGIAPPMGGPHAVMSLSTGATYQYDGNGNMTAGDGRSQTFDYLDRPTVVTKDTTTTKFRYAPDGSRYLQYTVTSSARTATYYVDKLAEHVTSTIISTGAQTDTDRSYVGPAVVISTASGVGRTVNYLHLDRLGSVQTITGPTAAEAMTDAHGMDAFGKPRDREWMDNGAKLHPSGGGVTNHGFTGHEHLDDTNLIHMNGRVYDYRLGRFLSVDPIISNPANSQSINPYSYIGNNPLSGVDPTGYAEQCVMSTGSHVCNAAPALLTINGSPAEAFASSKNSGATPLGKAVQAGSPADTAAPAAKQTNSNANTQTSPAGAGGRDFDNVVPQYPIAARVAHGWVFGPQEFISRKDAFTGQELDWSQRSLSLLSTAGVFLPFLSVMVAEGRTASVVQAVEASEATEAIQTVRGGAGVVRAGQAGEAAVRSSFDIGPKVSIEVAGRTRVPDGLMPGVLSEVKNVQSQSLTHQLRDYIQYAGQNSSRVDLYVRPGAQLSRPLLDARAAGQIRITDIPFR